MTLLAGLLLADLNFCGNDARTRARGELRDFRTRLRTLRDPSVHARSRPTARLSSECSKRRLHRVNSNGRAALAGPRPGQQEVQS
jgi:hypothetical protein